MVAYLQTHFTDKKQSLILIPLPKYQAHYSRKQLKISFLKSNVKFEFLFVPNQILKRLEQRSWILKNTSLREGNIYPNFQ